MKGATMDDQCAHEWIETEIQHTAIGVKYQQVGPCSYCPKCRRWSKRIRFFLDGRFAKNDAQARELQAQYNDRCKAKREAWVGEHYPEHAAPRRA
jgi:hypothetical protein